MAREFTYTTDPDFDFTIDEKGNTYIALRKIDWGNKGDYKLDLRKYYASDSGETMSKGVTMSDNAADELVKVLLETGYGDDTEITETILNHRPYLAAKIKKEMEKNPKWDNIEVFDNEDNFYDPEELVI